MEKVLQFLRKISLALLPTIICLLALSVLVAQFEEVGGNQEILPLSSFLVLISLSGLAFNWCRVSASFSPEPTLKLIYRSAIDLFLASLLALVSTSLAFVMAIPQKLPQLLLFLLFTLHWAFLALGLSLFCLSVLALVAGAQKIQTGQG